MLSPTIRQVAHALLTRPPLLRTRRYFTVRLECVMHAASVHPEPGSNSLKNCISNPAVSGRTQHLFQSFNSLKMSLMTFLVLHKNYCFKVLLNLISRVHFFAFRHCLIFKVQSLFLHALNRTKILTPLKGCSSFISYPLSYVKNFFRAVFAFFQLLRVLRYAPLSLPLTTGCYPSPDIAYILLFTYLYTSEN